MAGRVTELRYQKRNLERVNVYLDGEFAFGLPDIEAAKLRPGQYLNDADIERLQGVDVEQRAYDRAVNFLSYRPRSQAEVRRNLAGAQTDAAVIERVIERLTRQGYLDDVEFTRYWIENRSQFKPRGARALRDELRRKGVDDETSAELLSGLDAEEEAYRAAQGRASRLAPLLISDPQVFRRRLSDFLVRRGFDYDVVRAVVTRLEKELSESDQDLSIGWSP
jgi:regulatory protein